jgi:WXG100 family type VII secretion target
MTAQKVRTDYDGLSQIAQEFSSQAEAIRRQLQAMRQAKDVLEEGDWLGTGADTFYQEMNSDVLPTMARLAQALERASATTKQISQIMKQAEGDAASLFKLVDAGNGAAPSGPGSATPGLMPGPVGTQAAQQTRGSGRRSRVVGVRPGPGDTEIVTYADSATGAWISITRPRARDAREKQVQALIDQARADPKPENFQKAIDEAVKVYGIDISSVTGKPEFDPTLLTLPSPNSGGPTIVVDGSTNIISGKVIIGESAFQSPGYLASVIRHEVFHADHAQEYWHVDDFQSRSLMHVQVYDKQLAYAGADGLRASEIDSLKLSRSKYYDRLTSDNQKMADNGQYTIRR